MPQVKLNVKLLSVTPNARDIIYAAARQCYSSNFAFEILKEAKDDSERQDALISKLVRAGHLSPLEHVSFTFAIEGVSRVLTHQLVRHRIASFCLSGDTIIKGARQKSRNYKKLTLKSLYERTLTPHGRSRLKLIMLNSYDENRKVFDRGRIENIIYTGKQMVWKVNLVDGQTIKATLNHRFFSKDGWLSLKEIIQTKPELGVNGIACRYSALVHLRDKDWLYLRYNTKNYTQEEIANELGCSRHTIRAWVRRHGIQKETGGLHGHQPERGYRWKLKRKRTLQERKVISERMMGPSNPMWRGGITIEATKLRKRISPEIRKKVYERDGYQCRLCHKVGGELTLHHKIPIYADKKKVAVMNNLITLCRQCHWKINNREAEYRDVFRTNFIPYHSRSKGCYRTIKWAKIESITPHGIEDTYDIIMQEPHHNFIANGFLVHNSQQSQRYVKACDFNYVIPPSIERDEPSRIEFIKIMETLKNSYDKIWRYLKEKANPGEEANQDARFILPQAVETKIVVTMNCRQLLHFFKLRCSPRAQWEIRDLAYKMLEICRDCLPSVFGRL